MVFTFPEFSQAIYPATPSVKILPMLEAVFAFPGLLQVIFPETPSAEILVAYMEVVFMFLELSQVIYLAMLSVKIPQVPLIIVQMEVVFTFLAILQVIYPATHSAEILLTIVVLVVFLFPALLRAIYPAIPSVEILLIILVVFLFSALLRVIYPTIHSVEILDAVFLFPGNLREKLPPMFSVKTHQSITALVFILKKTAETTQSSQTISFSTTPSPEMKSSEVPDSIPIRTSPLSTTPSTEAGPVNPLPI